MNDQMSYSSMEQIVREQAARCGTVRLQFRSYNREVGGAIRTVGEMIAKGQCEVPHDEVAKLQLALLRSQFKDDADRVFNMTLTDRFNVGTFVQFILLSLRHAEAV